MSKEKKRFFVLDEIRGLNLISMLLYHGIWDLVYVFGVSVPWYKVEMAYIWQQSICWIFILLSGFCWTLGTKKLKRGILVCVCSIVISAVTIFFMPSSIILFGILSLLGTGMLIMIPLDKVFQKINPYVGMVCSFLLFLGTKKINEGVIEFFGYELLRVPKAVYSNLFTAYLGFPPEGFISYDYFPVIPWLFLYMMGYFMYRVFDRNDILKHLPEIRIKPLEWIGRHSLIIYMLHQPIVYAVLYVLFVR